MGRNSLPVSIKSGKPRLTPLPSGWERKTLDSYFKVESRKAKLIDDQEYDLVTVKRSRGKVVRRSRLLGREISVKSQFYIKEGDFLISKRQIAHGSCGIVPADLEGAVVSNEYCVLTPASNFYLPYVEYLSETIYFQQTCFHSSIGVHVEKMIFKLDDWFKWPFNIPPVEEQKAIVSTISTWDEAISATEKLIDNSKQQRKALRQKLLAGKQRLLDKNGERFTGEWVHGHLGELCNFKGGHAFKEEHQGKKDGDYPFIKVSDFSLSSNCKYIISSNNWVDRDVASIIKAKPLPKGAVVFAKVGAALLLNRRKILVKDTIIDNNLMAAIPKENVDEEYLYQVLMMIDFARLVQDGAVPSVNQGDLSNFKISYPAFQEQSKIADVLSIADQEIEDLNRSLYKLKQEKKSLIQQLLSGRKRVDVGESLC